MLFEWSAACAADDPVLVVPWSSGSADEAAGVPAAHFVDLRADPYALEEIREAEEHPALAHALRSLNAARSPVFTAKCDAWPITDPAELGLLALELMHTDTPELVGHAGYIDLLWRDRTTFASFHQHQHLMHRLERRIAARDHSDAVAECVIRPALLDFGTPQEGFAATLYIKALAFAGIAAEAEAAWSRALTGVVLTLRSRDLMPHTAGAASA